MYIVVSIPLFSKITLQLNYQSASSNYLIAQIEPRVRAFLREPARASTCQVVEGSAALQK